MRGSAAIIDFGLGATRQVSLGLSRAEAASKLGGGRPAE